MSRWSNRKRTCGRIAEKANAQRKALRYADFSTVTWKIGAPIVWQKRKHPGKGRNLYSTLRVRVGASCPGASLSSMCTGYKSASIEPVSVVT